MPAVARSKIYALALRTCNRSSDDLSPFPTLSHRDPFSISISLPPGDDRPSVLADGLRRPNGWSDAAASRHTDYPGKGRAGGAGELGHSRPGDQCLAAATGLPVTVSGTPEPQPCHQRQGNSRCNTLCRFPALAGRRNLDQSGGRPGVRAQQHLWRRGISQRRGLQNRQGGSLFSGPARVPAPDGRFGRRDRKARTRPEPTRWHPDRRPPGAHHRQILHRRHFRH